MSRKYELIKDGNRNRLRALRTWQVAGRTVNHGDLGGYVYDENTLSQDGACWIFSGAYESPLIRVYGDAIVDMNGINTGVYAGVAVPVVNIGGTSELIGVHRFQSESGSLYTFVPGDFEQGDLNAAPGTSYDNGKISSANIIRSKLITTNTGNTTFNTTNPAFEYAFIRYDKNKAVLSATEWKAGAVGGVVTISGNDIVYVAARIRKTPTAATTPADATAAALSTMLPIDSAINIINSRIVFNYTVTPSPVAGNSMIVKPNSQTATYVNTTNIINCDLTLNATGSAQRVLYLFGDFDNVQGAMTSTGTTSTVVGIWKNVKNLVVTGNISWTRVSEFFRNVMQVQDCDNFYFDAAVFPTGLINETGSAGYPVTFTRCNVPNGLFYHHPQIRNTYVDVDFSLAESELNEKVGNISNYPLVSSEVNGMYRAYKVDSKTLCALVECLESVSTWTPNNAENSYNTTIYRDAYINGRFQFAGNNVLGGSYGHDREVINDIGRLVVQGTYNTVTAGQTITGLANSPTSVCAPMPLRINGINGFKITGLTGKGLTASMYIVDGNNKIVTSGSSITDLTSALSSWNKSHGIFLRFSKTAGGNITPDDVKGITVTTYKGCKLVNTLPSSGVITIEGNNRIQDDAALYNTNIKGTSFLGGNSVIGTRDETYPVKVEGSVFMDGNAKFYPYSVASTALTHNLSMIENSEFTGELQSTTINLYMKGNARVGGVSFSTTAAVYIQDNANVQGTILSQCRGKLTLKDSAYVGSNLAAIGDITLCGSYRQTATATWYGKRVIDSANAPTYDDNVHTRYDF